MERKDTWAIGAAYEPWMGRWSRLVAREFLSWLDVPPGARWLDVGCGTGALTQTILELASPHAVKGVDPSEGFVQFTQAHITDPRASFIVGDAQALPAEDNAYDAVVAGLVLNFVPDTGRALSEMARVAKPGSKVGVYVWDYAGEMQMVRHFWDAAIALDPAALTLDQANRFPICRPEPLEQLFRESGLLDVEVRAIDVPTVFHNFEDYWSPFLGGQGAAPTYAVSLDEEQRISLRERIRSMLPISQDGSIHLIARAWAARGTRAV